VELDLQQRRSLRKTALDHRERGQLRHCLSSCHPLDHFTHRPLLSHRLALFLALFPCELTCVMVAPRLSLQTTPSRGGRRAAAMARALVPPAASPRV
jgi:hypothetical protein